MNSWTSTNPKKSIKVLRFGEIPYGQALALQLELRKQVYENDLPGFVVILQHPPVITLGKRGKVEDLIQPKKLAEIGAQCFQIDRGGEATFHGPGQLVVYPILNIERVGLGVVDLVRGLAESLKKSVKEIAKLDIEYDKSNPGLWTAETPARKMASVGMRISKKVSTHGASINLNMDLIPFSYFVACGMPNSPMTRLKDYLEGEVDIVAFENVFLRHFQDLFSHPFEESNFPLPSKEEWIRPDHILGA